MKRAQEQFRICSHCGKKTKFTIIAEHSIIPHVIPGALEQTVTRWSFFLCIDCQKPSLEEAEITTNVIHNDEYIIHQEEIYPPPRTTLSNLPKSIEEEYQAALEVKNISVYACAVLARRTLEGICKYENAGGRSLADQINNLLRSDRIPPLLAEMAHLGRNIGNLAAHVTEHKVTKEEVDAMLDFIETILEYLYVVPGKIAVIKEALQKENSPNSGT